MLARERRGGAEQAWFGVGDELDRRRRHHLAEAALGDEALAEATLTPA